VGEVRSEQAWQGVNHHEGADWLARGVWRSLRHRSCGAMTDAIILPEHHKMRPRRRGEKCSPPQCLSHASEERFRV
jgi:hypothetical protein